MERKQAEGGFLNDAWIWGSSEACGVIDSRQRNDVHTHVHTFPVIRHLCRGS